MSDVSTLVIGLVVVGGVIAVAAYVATTGWPQTATEQHASRRARMIAVGRLLLAQLQRVFRRVLHATGSASQAGLTWGKRSATATSAAIQGWSARGKGKLAGAATATKTKATAVRTESDSTGNSTDDVKTMTDAKPVTDATAPPTTESSGSKPGKKPKATQKRAQKHEADLSPGAGSSAPAEPPPAEADDVAAMSTVPATDGVAAREKGEGDFWSRLRDGWRARTPDWTATPGGSAPAGASTSTETASPHKPKLFDHEAVLPPGGDTDATTASETEPKAQKSKASEPQPAAEAVPSNVQAKAAPKSDPIASKSSKSTTGASKQAEAGVDGKAGPGTTPGSVAAEGAKAGAAVAKAGADRAAAGAGSQVSAPAAVAATAAKALRAARGLAEKRPRRRHAGAHSTEHQADGQLRAQRSLADGTVATVPVEARRTQVITAKQPAGQPTDQPAKAEQPAEKQSDQPAKAETTADDLDAALEAAAAANTQTIDPAIDQRPAAHVSAEEVTHTGVEPTGDTEAIADRRELSRAASAADTERIDLREPFWRDPAASLDPATSAPSPVASEGVRPNPFDGPLPPDEVVVPVSRWHKIRAGAELFLLVVVLGAVAAAVVGGAIATIALFLQDAVGS